MSPDGSAWTLALISAGLQAGQGATRTALAVSTTFGRVILGSEEVQRHVRFIANDPAIMRHRRNVKQMPCVKLNYAIIVATNAVLLKRVDRDLQAIGY